MRRNSSPAGEIAADGQAGGRVTSIDKAFEVCEALAGAERGLSITDLSKTLGLPGPTVHRLLAGLKRRGYVRQDDETARYRLTLKMLDLSFRLLGRSEIRLHAYPVVREFVLRTATRAFIAVSANGEVTYVWTAGPDEVAMHTVYGRSMPGHCAIYFDQQANRRLSCHRLEEARDPAGSPSVLRFGKDVGASPQWLNCTCAPVFDYSGREVARVGVFGHAPDGTGTLPRDGARMSWELARLISVRLGHLPAVSAAAM